MSPLRIPSQVTFPFGYRITVRQLFEREMNTLDAGSDGVWDVSTKTVYIRRRLPLARKRYILAHELGHAWLDWQHQYLDEGTAKS